MYLFIYIFIYQSRFYFPFRLNMISSSYQRVSCRKILFLKLTTDGAIDYSGGNEPHLLGTDWDLFPSCILFIRNCCYFVLDFILCVYEYVADVFWQPCENWRSQMVTYVIKGFCVHPILKSNPRPLALAHTHTHYMKESQEQHYIFLQPLYTIWLALYQSSNRWPLSSG